MTLIRGKTFLSSTEETTGYTAIVHKDTPIQVFVDRSDISLGVFSSIGKVLLVGRGDFDPAWIDHLGDSASVRFDDSRHFIVIKQVSKSSQTASYAAIATESVERRLRRAAFLVVPVGLAAGLVLALAVFFITRRQMSVRSLIKAALRRKEFFLVYQLTIDLRN